MSDDEAIETVAREAFEESLRSYGVSTSGVHRWDLQNDDVKMSWRRIALLVSGRWQELGIPPPRK